MTDVSELWPYLSTLNCVNKMCRYSEFISSHRIGNQSLELAIRNFFDFLPELVDSIFQSNYFSNSTDGCCQEHCHQLLPVGIHRNSKKHPKMPPPTTVEGGRCRERATSRSGQASHCRRCCISQISHMTETTGSYHNRGVCR